MPAIRRVNVPSTSDIQEISRDAVGAALSGGTGISITPDDTDNIILVSYTGSTDYWGKWTGTQAEYDALETYNDNILYAVVAANASFTWDIEDAFAATESPPAAADTGQTWRVESGTWSQTSGELTATADGAIIVVDSGSTTHTAEVVFGGTISAANSYPTLIISYDNTNDWHYRIVKYSSGGLRVQKFDSGGASDFWVQDTVSGITTDGVKIRASVDGTGTARSVRVWVNDVEQTTKTSGSATFTAGVGWSDGDSTPPNGQEVGMRYGMASGGGTFNYKLFKADPTVVVPA